MRLTVTLVAMSTTQRCADTAVLIVVKGAGVPMSLALWMTLSAHLADVLSVTVALFPQHEVSDTGIMDPLLLGINK